MTEERRALGERGEKLAVARLKKLGYRILMCNYRIRLGEIDIIAEDKGTLAFVEVKTRTGKSFGSPFEAITARKKRQLAKVAMQYISQHGLDNRPARFDVVSVVISDGKGSEQGTGSVEIIRNAFEV